MAIRGLEPLDGKLIDGLQFCVIAYDIFEAVQAEPGGLAELRLLRTQRAKKLVEEILPIASYVQNRYGPGCRLRVRWRGGNQPYDAIVRWSGIKVERIRIPRFQYVELTTAVHPNEHLAREHLHREGFSFGPHGTSRDPASKATRSAPTVRKGGDIERELAERVRARIRAKAAKNYSRHTSLIVRCVVSTVVLDEEWDGAVRILRKDDCPTQFREVVLVEPISNRVTTLFTRRRRRSRLANGSARRALQRRSEGHRQSRT